MDNQQMQQIRYWLDAVLRRKWMVVFFVLLGVSAGLAYYLSQPKVYRSSALLNQPLPDVARCGRPNS